MKKNIVLLLMAACLLLCGCAKTSALGINAASAAIEPSASPAATEEIDLSQMSSTMVYSYVFNMLTAPDDFVGERFRIRGLYDEGVWEPTGQTYHYIIIADATACCAQGMEFILTDETADYPEVGDEIEISGIFGTYEEDGMIYVQITADSIEKV